jgi:small subunit ribosomal protein S6e
MAEAKIVIGNKDGKTYQKVLDASSLVGRKIGDTIKGDLISLTGYELIITGGSNNTGTPMKPGVRGSRRTKVLAKTGVGIKKNKNKNLIRKSVLGETIGENITQINLKVTKEGTKKLEELFGSKEESTEEAPKEEKKEEAPKEEKKEKPSKEEKAEPYVPKGAESNEKKDN